MKKKFSTRFTNKVSSVTLFFLLISLFSSVLSQNVEKKICQTKECLSAAQNLKESINSDVNPCDDFYKYACGNWPKIHKTTNLLPQSTLRLRSEENAAEIFDFLKQNNSNDEPEAVHKARKVFSLCLNKAAYSNKLEPIEIILQKIGLSVRPFLSKNVEDFDFTTVLARMTRLAGITVYFNLGTSPNPFNQTLNIISLKRPSAEGNTDTLPLAGNHNSYRSKRATAKLTEQEYMIQITKKLCDNITSISCKQWISPYNFGSDSLTRNILGRNSKISQVILKPRNTLNSSIAEIYTLKQLQEFTDAIATDVKTVVPKLNWTRYIEEMYTGLDNVTLDLSDPNKVQIVVEELDFVKDVVEFIYKTENTKIIELELWWKVVSTLLPYIDFNTFETKNTIDTIGPLPTNEIRCADITTASFGLAVSYVYTTKEKYIKAKTEIRTMFEHIRESFQQIIQQLPWMDEMTRQRALKKLKSMKSYIVYPSNIKETNRLNDIYKDVQITDNFYDSMISNVQNQIAKKLRTLNQINKLNDLYEDDLAITPNIVNAYYDPNKNTFIIPAGILGLSIYNNSLRALDYGGIGSVIGHEMTHAFDNSGRRYNEIGNIENWWQPDVANSYREMAKCFVKAYGNYSTTSSGITQQTDSKLTLGEDISDNAGFKESLLAYKKCVSEHGEEPLLPQFENFTHEQLLTLAFANVTIIFPNLWHVWCENPTKLSELLSAEFAVHSPKGVRVNGVFRNSKEFSEIWKCPKGSNMNPNEEKCTVW